jgi:clan AA aspartic protease (TIGR02281 family)
MNFRAALSRLVVSAGFFSRFRRACLSAVFASFVTLAYLQATLSASASEIDLEPGQALTKSESQLDAAHALAQEVLQALGGIKKLQELFDCATLEKGRLTDFSALSDAVNSVDMQILSKGNKFKVDVQVLGQKAVTGYNGTSAWQQHGEEVFPGDPITSAKVAEDINHGFSLLLKFDSPALAMKILPDKVVQGKSCAVLEVQDSGSSTEFCIDKQSHMILATEYTGVDFEQGTEARRRNEYSDYRPCLGSLTAFKSVEFTNDKKTSEQQLFSVELADNISDSIFDIPFRKPILATTSKPVVLPFEFQGQEVVVKAQVNDRLELRFLLDTGATQNVMEKSIAQAFGAVTKSDMSITTGSGSVKMGSIILPSLKLGDIKLTDVPMAVADMPGFAQLRGGRPAGIIGANILRRFAVTIDYEERKIYFNDPKNVTVPVGALVVRAVPSLGSVGLAVDALIDGKLKVKLLVDTGAAFNSIPESLLKPELDFSLLPVGAVEGVDGHKVEVGSIRLRSLDLGKVSLPDQVFSVAPSLGASTLPGLLSASSLGILGNSYWSHFKVTIDYLNARILLEQSKVSQLMPIVSGKSRRISTDYLKDHNAKEALAAFDRLELLAQAPEFISVRANLALEKAKINASQALLEKGHKDSREASKAFETAYVIAKDSKDPQAQARVLAAQALFLLDNRPSYADVQFAKLLLQEASKMSESEPELLVAAAVYLAKSAPADFCRRIIDQALLADPSNLRALQERYAIAKVQSNAIHKQQVLEAFKHYYPELSAATFGLQ